MPNRIIHPTDDAKKKKLITCIRTCRLDDGTSTAFDPLFYQLFYDDLLDLKNPEELATHYHNIGKASGRHPTAAHLLKALGAQPSDLPDDFDLTTYNKKNFDLRLFEDKNENYGIEHYLKAGRLENRVYNIPYSDISKYDVTSNTSSSSKKIAILVHVYYPDLLPELHQYIDNLKGNDFDIYYNIVESIYHPSIEQEIKAHHPHANIIISKNYGRDIGGFIYLLQRIDFSAYDIFYLLHTKKSVHVDPKFSARWRQNLFNALLKNTAKTKENIVLMRNNPTIGMIGSGMHHSIGIEDNGPHYNALLEKFGISEEASSCVFLAGTMMMIRPAIVKPLVEMLDPVHMELCDVLDKQEQLDGLQAHAIERFIGNLVRHFGYTFFWQTED